jgi:hypothetical protein
MRKTLVFFLLIGVTLFGILPTASVYAEDQYRRWLSPKNFTCTTGVGGVEVAIDNQDIEFNNLPADAQYTLNYIKNGIIHTDGPFTVEQTSGTRHYAAFATDFASYPLTFDFRMDTIINGVVVYKSSIDITCNSDSSGPATIVNMRTIPTMNEWGMIIFMVLAGLGAVYYMMRQKRTNS